jgi:hypothetical protein
MDKGTLHGRFPNQLLSSDEEVQASVRWLQIAMDLVKQKCVCVLLKVKLWRLGINIHKKKRN